jgi:hypothetical protein
MDEDNNGDNNRDEMVAAQALMDLRNNQFGQSQALVEDEEEEDDIVSIRQKRKRARRFEDDDDDDEDEEGDRRFNKKLVRPCGRPLLVEGKYFISRDKKLYIEVSTIDFKGMKCSSVKICRSHAKGFSFKYEINRDNILAFRNGLQEIMEQTEEVHPHRAAYSTLNHIQFHEWDFPTTEIVAGKDLVVTCQKDHSKLQGSKIILCRMTEKMDKSHLNFIIPIEYITSVFNVLGKIIERNPCLKKLQKEEEDFKNKLSKTESGDEEQE